MVNLFMRLWCNYFGHKRIDYVIRNGKGVYYCKRCKRIMPLDKRGSIW
jgi:hypothetical protein